jgi:hypothetical protein
MIISASYKTDIPTFYGDWFINRLRAGYCKAINPYNRSVYQVDLSKEEVDGIVFWTKNINPFLKHLPEVHKKGFPFIVQYTINGYPRSMETSVVDANSSVQNIKFLSETYGPDVVVWRYDTIIFSSLTPPEFHLQNFLSLAEKLKGSTNEVVISFVQLYKKTLSNMNKSAEENSFTWYDPSPEFKYDFAAQLAKIAKLQGMQLSMCSQKEFLAPGVTDARCVDAERLSKVAGKPIYEKLKGNRPDCGCFASKDIGEYDTCPHGCVYCYSVQDRKLALSRYKEHDPTSEFLFTPTWYSPEEEKISLPISQGKLF